MKTLYLITDPELHDDDDNHTIWTADEDWAKIYPESTLVGEYILKSEQKVHTIRMGWMASFLSDCQTFGFIVSAFVLNYQFAGGDGWLSFLLFILAFFWICQSAASTSKADIERFKNPRDAIKYLESLK